MNHAWLETHIWHAKRFKMVERFGYKLAEQPCDKGFRSTYRASAHGCIMQVGQHSLQRKIRHGCLRSKIATLGLVMLLAIQVARF